MATAESYLKQIIGDLAVKNAILTSENDQLRSDLDALKGMAAPKPAKPVDGAVKVLEAAVKT